MRCKLRTILAGPNGCAGAGTIYDGEREEIQRLISAGYAVPCDESASTPAIETAELDVAIEAAVADAPKKRGRPRGRRKQ